MGLSRGLAKVKLPQELPGMREKIIPQKEQKLQLMQDGANIRYFQKGFRIASLLSFVDRRRM